jgi:hypothetical protein
VLRKVIKEIHCTKDGISDFRNKWWEHVLRMEKQLCQKRLILCYIKKKNCLRTCWMQQRILWHLSKGYFAGDVTHLRGWILETCDRLCILVCIAWLYLSQEIRYMNNAFVWLS